MDLMVDIETLGTAPGSVVLSIGACGFERDGDGAIPGTEFYRVISLRSCLEIGLEVNLETCLWWADQSPEAAEVLSKARDYETCAPAGDVIQRLHLWYIRVASQRPVKSVWANGSEFDFGLLAFMCHRLKGVSEDYLKLPWPFWSQRDMRTLVDVTDFNKSSIKFEGAPHNALDDARHQARIVQAAFRSMGE